MTTLAAVALVLALVPALLFLANLPRYAPPPRAPRARPGVSLLVPARNEETTIESCLEAACASTDVDLEIVVLDDASEDGTAARVRAFAARDPRVRLETAPPLPPGWCGKQHACAVLAAHATRPWFAFVDADVRLEPDALARLVAFLERSGAALVSGVPRQRTETLVEKLVIPLVHFVLLGFLPLGRMRASRDPAYGAGCGQLFAARADAYRAAGGHAAIRASLHDGIRLPRAFRAAGFATDLVDATELATCRMYRSAAEVWSGLAKNATEGMATPRLIVPATLLLVGGQVLPPILAVAALTDGGASASALALAACAAAWLPRGIGAVRFRQSALGALLHPLGVAILVGIQWSAFTAALAGRRTAWKGRAYAPAAAEGGHDAGPAA